MRRPNLKEGREDTMALDTKNPALGEKAFERAAENATADSKPMTLQGTVNKSFLLLALTVAGAAFSWSSMTGAANTGGVLGIALLGGIVAFVLALIIIFKQTTAPFLSPFYAVFEGLALGAVSAMYESRMPGIVINTIGLTFGTFLAMLFAYKSELIKPTEKFRIGVIAATGGIAILYIVDLVLSSFFHMPIAFIHQGGPIGIAFSAIVVAVAALNLVLDFQFIETGVARQAPKYMEWYASFGLLLTLVWLYLEILRLLSKVRNR
jgi:uncharacterized YccA/Bax inhibitor family protein